MPVCGRRGGGGRGRGHCDWQLGVGMVDQQPSPGWAQRLAPMGPRRGRLLTGPLLGAASSQGVTWVALHQVIKRFWQIQKPKLNGQMNPLDPVVVIDQKRNILNSQQFAVFWQHTTISQNLIRVVATCPSEPGSRVEGSWVPIKCQQANKQWYCGMGLHHCAFQMHRLTCLKFLSKSFTLEVFTFVNI